MVEYQVIARKYRPKRFREIVGQEPIVQTLVNAIKHNKLAHAYLFCGTRGTGKTTLARLFAKAINCKESQDGEPCNACSSCKEIGISSSMDVLEIDGASHRGIEDIRQINEGVGYVPTGGRYKIYIIDEVHMLTKEAFNALLKTLEEPPEKVKFFFATTEPHKIPPTILSRCQRFNLARIPPEKIEKKLQAIGGDLGIGVEQEVLRLLATLAEGSLRDAESLFDQVMIFSESEELSLKSVQEILGLVPKSLLFKLDEAGHKNDLNTVFSLAESIFSAGKNLHYFLEELVLHYRTLLMLVIGEKSSLYFLSEEEQQSYHATAPLFNKMQILNILDILVVAQSEIKFAPSERIYMEMVLMKIVRTFRQLAMEDLVERLFLLEKRLGEQKEEVTSVPPKEEENVQENQMQKLSRHDTVVRFAAKELQGTVKKL